MQNKYCYLKFIGGSYPVLNLFRISVSDPIIFLLSADLLGL